MKKLASYGTVLLLALAPLGLALPASATGPDVSVTVDRAVVRPGQTFTVTASAGVRCQWLVTWNGERQVRSGMRFRGSFAAPAADVRRRLPVRATCYYTPADIRPPNAAPPTGTAERVTVYVPERVSGGAVVTVVPSMATPQPPTVDPGLPNTGGPSWLLLLAGLASLAGGVVIVRRTTRRLVPRSGT